MDGGAFLDRSDTDPHQFRFVVSADEGARLADLKPFIRDLLVQMERDLDTRRSSPSGAPTPAATP